MELYEKNNYVLELQYFNLINGLSAKELAERQIDQSKDWKVISLTNVTVDGNPALKIMLSNNQTAGNELRKSATYTVVNNKGYGIVYQTAYPDPYITYIKMVEAIISSIKLDPNKTSNENTEILTDGNLLADYINPTYGIKINYPTNWSFENDDEDIDRAIYHVGDVDGWSTIVKFTPPEVASPDYFSFDLQFFNLPEGTSLGIFVQDEIDDSTTWNVLNRSETSISNHAAEKVIFTQKGDNSDFKRLIVYTLVNGKGYATDYSDSYPHYETYISAVENMIKSLEISGTTSLDEPIEWTAFEDANLGISLEYPTGWEIEHKLTKFEEGPEVTITDPADSGTGKILIIKPLTLRSSLFDTELVAQIAQNQVSNEEDARIIDEVNMNSYKIDGKQAGTFLYSVPNPITKAIPSFGKLQESPTLGNIFKMDDYARQIVVTNHNKKIYVFGFEATTGDFEGYNSIMDHIFESIKFIR